MDFVDIYQKGSFNFKCIIWVSSILLVLSIVKSVYNPQDLMNNFLMIAFLIYGVFSKNIMFIVMYMFWGFIACLYCLMYLGFVLQIIYYFGPSVISTLLYDKGFVVINILFYSLMIFNIRNAFLIYKEYKSSLYFYKSQPTELSENRVNAFQGRGVLI